MQVRDIDATEAWWTRTFGYRVLMRRDLNGPAFESVSGVPGARSRMLRGLVAPDTELQFFWHSWRGPVTPNLLLSFEVRDAAAAHAALVGAGVTCTGAPVEFDNSWAFTTSDHDGLPIEIIQWKADVERYRFLPVGA